MAVDFGLTADDYARHRQGFPESLFDRLRAFGVGLRSQTVLDVGTGTGTLARGFARRGCDVIAIDPAEAMLEQARRLDEECGVTVDYRMAVAEKTGLPDARADVFVAGQCWHWFDRQAAAQEAYRVLRRGGRAVICHFDWLSLAGNVVEATEALISEHNPGWPSSTHHGMYPQWTADLAAGGFTGMETFSYDVDTHYSHEAWRGRIRASAGVAASLTPDAVAAFDDALASLLSMHFCRRSPSRASPGMGPCRDPALIPRAPSAGRALPA